MIIDRYENIRFYKDLLPNLDAALKAIEKADEMPLGKYTFDGGWFMIQEGTTRPFEGYTYVAHRKYIDVQILLEGAEEIAWNTLDRLETAVAYDEAGDKERLKGDTDVKTTIYKSMFWAAFPHDAHMAISHSDTPHTFKKIVLKLPVNG
ncbi:MAG: YhcH/YjgK/YiaL family protein [Solobacterium sp.]|nr:YhcH/YjgK/YiaL family protein [Solobacterium sp.]